MWFWPLTLILHLCPTEYETRPHIVRAPPQDSGGFRSYPIDSGKTSPEMSKHGLLNHFYTQAAMKTKFDRAVNVIIAPGNSDFNQNAWIISSSLVERRARSLSVLRLAREYKNLSATLGDCRKR